MNHEPNADESIHELIALSAVNALDPDEQAALDAALVERPDLRDELDELRATAATLAEATAEPPPPSLRADVLAAIAAEPQLPSRAPADHSVPATSSPPATNVVPLASKRRRWTTAVTAVAAVAAAVLAFVVIAPGDDDGQIDVAAVVDADDRLTMPMGGELSGMQMVHSPSMGATALVGTAVPPPQGDDVYELWLIRDAAKEPLGTFLPDDDGDVALMLDASVSPDGATFAVTVEPPGGSDQPTTPPVAST
jgi:anti-sigma-K factor RskA